MFIVMALTLPGVGLLAIAAAGAVAAQALSVPASVDLHRAERDAWLAGADGAAT